MGNLENLAVSFHDGDEHVKTVDGLTAESAAKAARIWLAAGDDREVFVSDGWDTMGPLEKGVTGDDLIAWFDELETYRESQVSWDADEDPIEPYPYDEYGEDYYFDQKYQATQAESHYDDMD